MATVKARPTSPGRRFTVSVSTPDLHKGDPYAPLLEKKTKSGGRSNKGRITTRHIGGGHKQRYRVIDFKRNKDGLAATVERIEYDPNRTANIALLLYVDGEPMEAEVLDADSARNYYESIVRRQLDPALLEYIGTNTFRARIWPIRAHGERRVQISYDEILEYDNGLIRYLYPLNTEKFSFKPLESVIIRIALSSPVPVKSIYSPSHTITTQKEDDYNADILYEDENVTPDTDFLLYYTVSTDDIGMNCITYRELGEDGYYLLLAAPKVEVNTDELIQKRMIFVLDRSGSMSGTKIDQAKEALKFCINNLNAGDLFNIIDFSS